MRYVRQEKSYLTYLIFLNMFTPYIDEQSSFRYDYGRDMVN